MIDVTWLVQNGPCKVFQAGQTIPCPGGGDDTEKAMYILLTGRIDITPVVKKTVPAIALLPGEVFGGAEFFTGKGTNVYTAVVDSVVYEITESSFPDLSWSKPDIVFEVLKASYIPQGRPASQVKATPAKTAAPVAEKAKAVKGETKNTPEKSDATPPGEHEALAALQAAIPVTGDIYPEGHKNYPGITKPLFSKLVYPKDYTCPFCKKTFKDFKIFGSKLYESAPMRYDMRKYYTDFQSEWYDIITCRHCYFSTVHSVYADSKPILKQKVEQKLTAARSSIFMDFDAERNIDFVFTSHYLALLCADGYLSFANPVRAKVWGNLSWLYEDVGDKDMEVFAAKKAAEAYEEVYTGTRLTPVQEQTTCLSIAGMQRRAGIDKDLKKILYQVKTQKMGDKAYVKLAEDLMYELREK